MKGEKKLVIVESPTKARTISGYLGDDYEVIASVGHIRDLAEPSELPAELKKAPFSARLSSETVFFLFSPTT